ncbi:MAG: glycosyltransferase [Planctomycetota bacterium]
MDWTGPDLPELSVVLPCYRSADLARRSVEELTRFLDAEGRRYEVLVVDDGGGDFAPEPWDPGGPVRLLRLPQNRGKGAAVRAGMLAARGRARVFTDVDLPYDLDLIPLCARYLLEGDFHLVVGDRWLPDSRYDAPLSVGRQLGSAVFSQVFGRLVTSNFFDTQCGLKAFRGDVADLLFARTRVDRFAFDVEVIYLALKNRLEIKRIPVQLRHNETSSVRLVRDGAAMAKDVLRIKLNQVRGLYRCPELARLACDDVARARSAGARAPRP